MDPRNRGQIVMFDVVADVEERPIERAIIRCRRLRAVDCEMLREPPRAERMHTEREESADGQEHDGLPSKKKNIKRP